MCLDEYNYELLVAMYDKYFASLPTCRKKIFTLTPDTDINVLAGAIINFALIKLFA